MKKCVLLIDMDGTACDWSARLKQNFELKFPDRKLKPISEFHQFYVEDSHPDDWRDDIAQISRQPGFYESLLPIEGAIEALKDIEENCLDFIEPFLCSSPEVEYETQLCHTEKARWVEEHLGRFWTKRLILTKDKTLVRGHILLDDKPLIKGALTPTWTHFVYEQPWNARVANLARFNWSKWTELRDGVLRPNFGPSKLSSIVTKSEQPLIITG